MEDEAGRSARSEYERRRNARWTRIRSKWWAVLIFAVATASGIYFIWGHVSAALSGTPFQPRESWRIPISIGVAVIASWTALVATQPERAWRRGAYGERVVGKALSEIASGGIPVLHDRRQPNSRANFDHLVVSPTGVFVIDTKNYTGRVRTRRFGKELWVDGRNRSNLLSRARSQAQIVEDVLRRDGLGEIPVTPVVCFITFGPSLLDTGYVTGVLVTNQKKLARRIARRGSILLNPDQVQAIASTLDRFLPPYGRTQATAHIPDATVSSTNIKSCDKCGSPMVKRTRKSDGAPFYGCSTYPRCRHTRDDDPLVQ